MKTLKFALCLLALAVFTFSTDVFAGTGPMEKPGQGEQHCNHTGGKDLHAETAEFDCLEALASNDPELIMEACESLEEEEGKHMTAMKKLLLKKGTDN